MQSPPPTKASAGGTSSSRNHAISAVMNGTRNVDCANFPASAWLRAYAQVVKAIALGKTPR